jgi:hypothetical protein
VNDSSVREKFRVVACGLSGILVEPQTGIDHSHHLLNMHKDQLDWVIARENKKNGIA